MPYQPYAAAHSNIRGPGDDRPSAIQMVRDCHAVDKLHGKKILITGCSGGLGIETARALYATGAKLFLTARDIPKLQDVINDIVKNHGADNAAGLAQPEAIELHLESLASIRKASQAILARTGGTLDVLILNAGIMAGPLEHTVDGFERQFATNHLAGFLLFQLLKPALLRAAHDPASPSRVIILSSSAHTWSPVHFHDLNWARFPMTYNQWQAYGSSKSANVYTASAIDRKYGPHIRAWSVHPGGIHTSLGRNLGESDFAGFGDVEKIFSTYKNAEQGAATTVWAALDDGVLALGGKYLADCGETLPCGVDDGVNSSGFAEHVYDGEAEEKLWNISAKLVGRQEDSERMM